MIITPDHVRYAHVQVVHHHAEVVGRIAVGARNDQIVEFAVLEHHPAVHLVIDHDFAIERIAKPHDRIDSGPWFMPVAAAPVVTRLLLGRYLPRPQLLELGLGAVAIVGVAGGAHLREHFAITWVALRLVIRPFIGVQIQPRHAIEDDLYGLLGRSLAVGVFDPQDELPAVVARVQP